ncbi:DUF2334 domain-containing protein [Actinokineospora sp. 24-640]
MTARLVVSLSGINARTLPDCAAFAAELDRRGVPLSLLLAPRAPAADVVAWVRDRRATGDALLAHGFDHAAEPRGRRVALGRRAEFAALPAHEAGLRLTAVVAALDAAGLATDAFAPPRWFASPGTLLALRLLGFTLCADLFAVRELGSGTVHHGRALVVGRRAEPWWCYALVQVAARTARRGGLIRVAADAADLTRPGPRQALLDAVDIASHHGAEALTYPGLRTAPAGARAVIEVPRQRQKVSFQELR